MLGTSSLDLVYLSPHSAHNFENNTTTIITITTATATMMPVSNILCLGALLAIVFTDTTQASHLRAHNNDNNDNRNLQLDGILFNSLVDAFGPSLVDAIQTTLTQFDPIVLGDGTTFKFGEMDLSARTSGVIDCRSSASVTYGLGSISGLSSIEVNRMEMVPGSETIDSSFLGLSGASWEGTWILNATFANMTAETSASLTASACGVPISQKVTGTTTFNDPTVEFTITMGGATANLLRFTTSSQITTVTIKEMNFELGSIDANLGSFGTILQLDIGNTFDAFLLNELSDIIAPLVLNLTNDALASQLPYSF